MPTAYAAYIFSGLTAYIIIIKPTFTDSCFLLPAPVNQIDTRSQVVARIADRTASQHLWGSRDLIGYWTILIVHSPYSILFILILC